VLLGGHALAQESLALTLDECIDVALKNNQNIKNAKASYAISKHKVGEFLADGLPQISASADLGYNFKLPTSFIPAEFFGGEAGTFAPVQFSPAYNGSASVQLDQMIFNGSYFIGLKASRTYTDLAKKDHIKSKIDVVDVVSRAYYLVLVNAERMELIEKNYQRLDSLLRDTRIMYENGFAEKIDVDRIKVQYNNIKVELDNFQNSLDLSMALLKFQMGLDINSNLELKDKLEDIQFQVIDENFSSEFDYKDRIEYSILQTNLDLVNLDIKNTQVRYIPTLELYGAYGASTGTQSFTNLVSFGDYWFGFGVIGLRLNVPIFDGFRKSKMIQQKKLQVEQIENTQDQLRKNIDFEILQAKTNLKKNVDNLVAQRENLELADNVYKVTKIKYEEGIGSNIEVIEADATYKEAQINYYDALYNALVAKVGLEKAYGKLTGNETEN
jgi:outer membrane protein TolC